MYWLYFIVICILSLWLFVICILCHVIFILLFISYIISVVHSYFHPNCYCYFHLSFIPILLLFNILTSMCTLLLFLVSCFILIYLPFFIFILIIIVLFMSIHNFISLYFLFLFLSVYVTQSSLLVWSSYLFLACLDFILYFIFIFIRN